MIQLSQLAEERLTLALEAMAANRINRAVALTMSVYRDASLDIQTARKHPKLIELCKNKNFVLAALDQKLRAKLQAAYPHLFEGKP